MLSPPEIAVTNLERAGTLMTFEAFRRATRGLPPSMQLAEFLRLPERFQAQAWASLHVDLGGDNDLASAA